MDNRTITAIFGMEPRRADELPAIYTVGSVSHVNKSHGQFHPFTVDSIKVRQDYKGTYAIVWFDVCSADRVELSLQAFAVAEVHYAPDAGA